MNVSSSDEIYAMKKKIWNITLNVEESPAETLNATGYKFK
jgi:hypothetical protein